MKQKEFIKATKEGSDKSTGLTQETNDMKGSDMRYSDVNIQVAQQYFESLRSGNLDQLAQLLDDDIVWHQPGRSVLSGTYIGKQKVFALFGKFMEISNGTFKIDSGESVLANGNVVAATLNFSATHVDGSISMKGVDIMKIVDGKIVEVHLFSEHQVAEDKFWNLAK